MLRGLTTVSFFADDLSAARDWYTEVLGVAPYFQASSRARGTSALRRETRSSKPSPTEPAKAANRRVETP